MKKMKGFQADFFNGWEEDGEPVPVLKKSIVIETKMEKMKGFILSFQELRDIKYLWKRIREFLRRR